MDKIKLYSPGQVAAGAFFGGPFAAVYVLLHNFRALGNDTGARYARLGGIIFIAALFVTLPLLPDRFPNSIIPAVYTVAAWRIAEMYQVTKQALRDSDRYTFQSNWNVAGISVGFILAFLVIALAWLFALDAAGVVRL